MNKLQGQIVWLEGLGQLQNQITSLGMETTTFWACSIVPQPIMLSYAHIW
jgi:hypothetical protein